MSIIPTKGQPQLNTNARLTSTCFTAFQLEGHAGARFMSGLKHRMSKYNAILAESG